MLLEAGERKCSCRKQLPPIISTNAVISKNMNVYDLHERISTAKSCLCFDISPPWHPVGSEYLGLISSYSSYCTAAFSYKRIVAKWAEL